ncbi:MAG: DUF512 domain-containing protein [Candidatus Sericytochromatia bacterium]|uniref:DUF512 domain-containing protein n=1 Tax=Candidatus Tanganyikabacteria bacterium TaxID=2961651 RepID=A0A938BNQ1_9BACT|nr:DUF512 domain-containing protein [Candidatus Tanganyikabacteria bacterium]
MRRATPQEAGLKRRGGLISAVAPGSLAAAAGLSVGDRLEAVGDFLLQDLIDYRYQTAEPRVRLRLWRGDDAIEVDIRKDPDEDLGLAFDEAVFDRVRQCANKCEFCFIHQMPEGFRDSLYIEDDDYRLSFLQGNFITMTNLAERDWKRIGELRLSPLYVSVHTTNVELRREMLKQPLATRLHAQLDRLTGMGIDFHAQIVLVPGRNDGAELDRTLSELLERWSPHVLTICIVPFGATRFRQPLHLPPLAQPTPEWCQGVISQVKTHQQRLKKAYGDPIVRLADEFYIQAGVPFPGVAHYGDFPNLGDGVGGARLLAHEWSKAARKLPGRLQEACSATLITGRAARSILQPIVDRLNQVGGLSVRLLALPSRYWGDDITVTGLLTGSDVAAGLRETGVGGTVWLPDIMLRSGTRTFLDDRTVADVATETGADIQVLTTDARGLLTAATAPEHLDQLLSDRWYGSYYK